jgi:hypothetical protein
LLPVWLKLKKKRKQQVSVFLFFSGVSEPCAVINYSSVVFPHSDAPSHALTPVSSSACRESLTPRIHGTWIHSYVKYWFSRKEEKISNASTCILSSQFLSLSLSLSRNMERKKLAER